MSLSSLQKRRGKLTRWERALKEIRTEMEAEYVDDRPLLIMLLEDAATECAQEERRLLREAQGRFSALNRAACRVQSPEEP